MNCPAQFSAKKLLYFPQFEIKEDARKHQKCETLKKLRSSLWKCKVTPTLGGTESTTVDDDIDFLIPEKKPRVEDNHTVQSKLIFAAKFPR